MDINKIIDRAKLFLNAKSDNELSQKLGKFPSYIAQLRKRDNIDLDLFLTYCPDVDLNWLLTGNPNKERKIAQLDEKGNRQEVDLGSDKFLNNTLQFVKDHVSIKSQTIDKPTNESEVDEIIKQLKEKDFILFETMKQLHEAQKIIAEYQLRDRKE